MTIAKNSGGERTDEAGWPCSHRKSFLERLDTQGYAAARSRNIEPQPVGCARQSRNALFGSVTSMAPPWNAFGTTCSAKCTPSISSPLHQLEPAQIALHQFGQSALRTDHEPLADRALADAANLDLRWQRFQRVRVASGRDSQHHLLESSLLQRFVRTPRLPAWQAQFMAIGVARARTPNLDPPAAQYQRTRHVAGTNRLPMILMHSARHTAPCAPLPVHPARIRTPTAPPFPTGTGCCHSNPPPAHVCLRSCSEYTFLVSRSAVSWRIDCAVHRAREMRAHTCDSLRRSWYVPDVSASSCPRWSPAQRGILRRELLCSQSLWRRRCWRRRFRWSAT